GSPHSRGRAEMRFAPADSFNLGCGLIHLTKESRRLGRALARPNTARAHTVPVLLGLARARPNLQLLSYSCRVRALDSAYESLIGFRCLAAAHLPNPGTGWPDQRPEETGSRLVPAWTMPGTIGASMEPCPEDKMQFTDTDLRAAVA